MYGLGFNKMFKPTLGQIWCFPNCPSKSNQRCRFYLICFKYLPWDNSKWHNCQSIMIEKCNDHDHESLGVGNIIEFSEYSFSDRNIVLEA